MDIKKCPKAGSGRGRVDFFVNILLYYFINVMIQTLYISAVLLLFTLYSLHIVSIVVF